MAEPQYRPELTKWPFTTHKRTYRERDGLIVALDQAFGNFLVFSMDCGRTTEIECFPSLRLSRENTGDLPPKHDRQTLSEWAIVRKPVG